MSNKKRDSTRVATKLSLKIKTKAAENISGSLNQLEISFHFGNYKLHP